MTDIKSMTKEELKAFMSEIGEKPFRADQIFSWIHEKRARSFDEMSNLSLGLREKLKTDCTLPVLVKERVQVSRIDGTRKYLFLLADGNLIEAVFMRYQHGNSVCVSTQVGCRMGCRFCASTIDGMVRSLEPSEILDEVYSIGLDTGEPVNNVVLMGSGEPLDNYDNVIRFIRLLCDPKGQNLSMRNITLSTCGLPEGIRRLAGEGIPLTLALSLHAPDDETRKKLMPIANRYGLKEVMAACDYYFEKTGRRMSYEYSVVKGVNDNREEAGKLAALLAGKNAHVNLIPVNKISERPFEKPDQSGLAAFKRTLEEKGINVTVRREMGSDIDGACGQLRRKILKETGGNGKLNIYGSTDKGKRRKNNEDTFFVSSGPVGMFDRLAIVADGMGGLSYGEVASGTAVETFVKVLDGIKEGTPFEAIEQAVSSANLEVRKKAELLENSEMGTTFVCAAAAGDTVYAANIGDSRLYMIDPDDGMIRQITRDHSYVEEMVAKGLMERGSEQYMKKKNVITRAVGVFSEVEADLFEMPLKTGSFFVLCSDGLSNMIDDETIRDTVLDKSLDLCERTVMLVEKANRNGGKDNITVVLMEADEVKS